MDLNKFLNNISNYIFGPPQVKKPNLGEDVQNILLSKNFESQIKSAAPFLACTILAWPTYWAYRGFEWHKQNGDKEALAVYINKTYYKAKMLQFMLLTAGILYAVVSHSLSTQTEKPIPINYNRTEKKKSSISNIIRSRDSNENIQIFTNLPARLV